MDRRLVLTILALCIINVDSAEDKNKTQPNGSSNNSHSPMSTISNPSIGTRSAPCTIPTQTQGPPPILGVLNTTWKQCEGDVHLTLLNSSQSRLVCASSKRFEWPKRCERRGCQGTPKWITKQSRSNNYYISDSGEITVTTCQTLAFKCDVVPDTSGELVGYKVVTFLLCVLVLLVLMIRFGKPSLKAFRKKMSDRRQSRWIGPTQSQSVSYHRGKAGLQLNDNTDKRSSFPGLERLTVNNSREPSSNRNSDYDSYHV